jgi:hypothetical protein
VDSCRQRQPLSNPTLASFPAPQSAAHRFATQAALARGLLNAQESDAASYWSLLTLPAGGAARGDRRTTLHNGNLPSGPGPNGQIRLVRVEACTERRVAERLRRWAAAFAPLRWHRPLLAPARVCDL